MSDGNGSRRGSEEARAYAAELSGAFGRAVNLYRTRLGLSAVQLSNRCNEHGYPITRGTIAKIESNTRNAKMDVAEVLILAAALEVAPADLMFPGYPDRSFVVTPRTAMSSAGARQWFDADWSYNEFEQLHTPRVTLSKELRQAVDDFGHAVQAFENRHQVEVVSGDTYYLADYEYDAEAKGIGGWRKKQLEKEYAQIQSLQDRVVELGGYVQLPKWFGTFECLPF